MKALTFLFSHRTKLLGYVGVTLGVLATSTVLPAKLVGWLLLANSLMTALVGHYNSHKNAPKLGESPPA
jgi:hypothetical protein